MYYKMTWGSGPRRDAAKFLPYRLLNCHNVVNGTLFPYIQDLRMHILFDSEFKKLSILCNMR